MGDFKRKMEYSHLKTRSKERLGLDINRKDNVQMRNLIQKGEALFLEKESQRVSTFYMRYEGKEFVAVYDKHRKQIVTVFYPNADKLPLIEKAREKRKQILELKAA
jgi:hypothetical protein